MLYMICMTTVALGNLSIATYSLLKSQLNLEDGEEDTTYLVKFALLNYGNMRLDTNTLKIHPMWDGNL